MFNFNQQDPPIELLFIKEKMIGSFPLLKYYVNFYFEINTRRGA